MQVWCTICLASASAMRHGIYQIKWAGNERIPPRRLPNKGRRVRTCICWLRSTFTLHCFRKRLPTCMILKVISTLCHTPFVAPPLYVVGKVHCITWVSSSRCHHPGVIIQVSSSRCHHLGVTTLLSSPGYHHPDVIIQVSWSECHRPSVITDGEK